MHDSKSPEIVGDYRLMDSCLVHFDDFFPEPISFTVCKLNSKRRSGIIIHDWNPGRVFLKQISKYQSKRWRNGSALKIKSRDWCTQFMLNEEKSRKKLEEKWMQPHVLLQSRRFLHMANMRTVRILVLLTENFVSINSIEYWEESGTFELWN